ncbi:SDR family NAD(P)-dependent oxidoreductase [Aestuariivirga sp.]|jgi:NAD(P)-dependent dehydrogenase (short-subunit alcohol dehydrogenase family)|uniref:SDR family NAD(P)-dependent oxidoreductase n=1 Tax=Aestuariivirga sp. TaxID=2650926 RepID=UPI003782E748
MALWPSSYFADRHVLVTGGTSGIGAAIAQAFLAEGAHVTATGISRDETDRARAQMPGLKTHVLDVKDGAAVEGLIASFSELGHLVNCAGVIRRGTEHDPAVFADVLNVNLTGTMRMCTAARTKLAACRGSIVNIASVLSYLGGGLVPGYSASKGGITQLTKSLAIAYAPDGIRVNAVAPGWIDTPLTDALRSNAERNAAILARTPLGRWGRPEDISGGVLFLCSPLADFVTGTVLAIDGGYLSA